MEIELERTFLVKEIPIDLRSCEHIEVCDLYISRKEGYPILRIRKRGDGFEITKKMPVEGADASHQHEYTIVLTKKEFDSLNEAKGERIRKFRYFYPYAGLVGEISIFQDQLKGLVLADFEFRNEAEKNSFKMPEFCLAEVTQDLSFVGGSLAGMKYEELEDSLKKYSYEKIIFRN